MSLESGGRADKYGNQYENRYFARLLLRLVNEEFVSIEVEPLGIEGVEYTVTTSDGKKLYYQCKASNNDNHYWRMSDLKKHNVFSRSRTLVEKSDQNYYYFISPLQYNQLDELCKRARTNSSPQDFINYQLTNKTIRSTFSDCANNYNLNEKSKKELIQLIYILSHCHFELFPIGQEAEQDLNEHVGMFFTGKASIARLLLEHYAIDTDKFGVKITANDVIKYLEERDIHVRNYHHDNRILLRIDTLNNVYWDVYKPINNKLFHRDVTDIIVKHIQNGNSIILHGKAGSGKSGCIQEIINYFQDSNIIYLSIKLDKHVPEISADKYGESLDLPQSPVHCLHNLSAGKPCVLILDQLDSLCWTSKHSSTALDICKEMIIQAHAINKHQDGKISIVFVTRTFDLENDKGLQTLFTITNNNQSLIWHKLSVNILSDLEVKNIVGKSYDMLSSRLKVILKTPSSLFAWTHLNNHDKINNITSVYQLIDAWWNQILDGRTLVDLSRADVLSCKNDISIRMNENSVFSLPLQLFTDFKIIINYLVSAGMLVINENSISFTHQSFLDYFIISDTLREIYNGQKLIELIGNKTKQTPNLRYRLLTILQSLLDSDEKMFLNQSEKILISDDIRYYFKCTVFEIIGQHDSPDDKIFALVETYLQFSEWHDFIIQTVYYGHLMFIKRLHKISVYPWIENEGLSLLKSISYKAPDFVIDVLNPYSFIKEEHDRKIFWTLCHNPIDDSENMFQMRMKLLNQYPDLFVNFWGFSTLLEQLSDRAVLLMKIIILKTPEAENIYFSEDEKLDKYIQHNYKIIFNELFPIICEATKDFLPQYSSYNYNENEKYRIWIAHKSSISSSARKIVEIVKKAVEVIAQNNPNELMKFIGSLKSNISVVGHEIIMHAVENLSIIYGDKVIQWLLTDFSNKVFVYTSDESDYLVCSKRIIKKFSPVCKYELFKQLENTIYSWKDDTKKIVWIYKRRTEMINEHKCQPVYYAYWGHFQKELLPFMDNSRLSQHAKNLFTTLNRNPRICTPFYYSGISTGIAKGVVSPINDYMDRLSDKTWMRIISTPNEKMQSYWRHGQTNSYYVEATHESFSDDFFKQAKKHPLRFAKLSLEFPNNCYPGYISSVIRALQKKDENDDQIDITLVCDVIRRYKDHKNNDVVISIASLIKSRADEPWPEDILYILERIALGHPNPKAGEYTVKSSQDPQSKTPYSLLTNSINCARGCAIYAIANLILNHKDMGDRFKQTITTATYDVNDAVRFSVVSCVLAYSNIDPKFSVNTYKKLLSLDIRILASPDSWNILSEDYQHNCEFYRSILITACKSDIEELAICASKFACAIAIFFEDQEMLDYIITTPYTHEQKDEICFQAIYLFNHEKYHNVSEKILRHFIGSSSTELTKLNHLFFDHRINIPRDIDFLIYLMQSKQSIYQVHKFLNYLNESYEDITMFADILSVLGKSISSALIELNTRFDIGDFIQCILHLFDIGKDDTRIRNICLDIWDNFFKNNYIHFKPLSDMIDN